MGAQIWWFAVADASQRGVLKEPEREGDAGKSEEQREKQHTSGGVLVSAAAVVFAETRSVGPPHPTPLHYPSTSSPMPSIPQACSVCHSSGEGRGKGGTFTFPLQKATSEGHRHNRSQQCNISTSTTVHKLMVLGQGRTLWLQKVGGSMPSSSSPHVQVFLGMTLNLNIPLTAMLAVLPLSKAPYSPNICSPGAVHGRSLLSVSCTRWAGLDDVVGE
ncbi:unnamed protein product [Pleuronectes platessa]|uniref:Uncharacterized protein n=1 Tax=Pleuronectes platessa TaxID=8262 RepID=A0A9N7U736_PLEPL|nr:unnamed protein product [Pleuronectes platessa]